MHVLLGNEVTISDIQNVILHSLYMRLRFFFTLNIWEGNILRFRTRYDDVCSNIAFSFCIIAFSFCITLPFLMTQEYSNIFVFIHQTTSRK